MRHIVTFAIILSYLIGCNSSSTETAIKFNHSYLESEFLIQAEEVGIKLRKDQNNYYWYSMRHQQDVEKITSNNNERVNSSAWFTPGSRLNELKRRLERENIKYEEVVSLEYDTSKNWHIVMVDDQFQDRYKTIATEIFNNSVSNSNK